ncbi:RepB family plasmid replication initiator protein [Rugamonas apoptosis]|uniref:Initiator Rep protein WH1 domain-containing protein n=1 Tax=Rugamonas apoptosis TaxID=2758570 RepID=A0A7W2F7T8_9BURK|nr:RepB family plasmid replication initiator protein [Rugamonas apoptosis]MBA5686722.1 hypothetical protein [Rugamonas apoptosis]
MLDILPPESTDVERERRLQWALAESARNLSVDERYILRRMASVVAQSPAAAREPAGALITIPVVEFAAHAGLTPKVAFRRLDVATHALFDRSVCLNFDDGATSHFVWADSLTNGIEYFDLRFSGTFISYLFTVLRSDRAGVPRGLLTFSDLVSAPAVLDRGQKMPYGLPIVLISRLKARKKRPKTMPMSRLLVRVARRLKNVVSKERLDDIFDVIHRTSRWRRMEDARYYKFTHRDLDEMHDWIVKNMDKPGFFDE